MDLRGKCEHLPLKRLYYGLFLGLIAIPLFLVFIIALLVLNQQFKRQALENIDRAQETVIAELLSDVDVMSMRLSHMLYADNNQVLAYAAAADVENVNLRYENEKKLAQAVNMIFEPVTDVISINFAMYDGREIYVKNKITRPMDEIRQEDWYQAALEGIRRRTILRKSLLSAAWCRRQRTAYRSCSGNLMYWWSSMRRGFPSAKRMPRGFGSYGLALSVIRDLPPAVSWRRRRANQYIFITARRRTNTGRSFFRWWSSCKELRKMNRRSFMRLASGKGIRIPG